MAIVKKKTEPRTINEQNTRMQNQTEIWDKMVRENPTRECIIMGDFNVDAHIWPKNEEEKPNYIMLL